MSTTDRVEYLLAASPDRQLFIETGTATGFTADVMGNHFEAVFSIELVQRAYSAAVIRFIQRQNITIIHGDSPSMLTELLYWLPPRPMTLWLDAHDNGELPEGVPVCPVLDELKAFFARGWHGCAVVIDDADLFGVEAGYPSFRQVESYVRSTGSGYQAVLDGNFIKIQE